MNRRFLTWLAVLILLISLPPGKDIIAAPAETTSVSPRVLDHLPQAGTYVPGQLLVTLAAAPDATHNPQTPHLGAPEQTDSPTILTLDNYTLTSLPAAAALNLYTVQVQSGAELAAMRKLAAQPQVRSVDLDYIRHIDLIPDDTSFVGEQWALRKINAPAAWDITTGSQDVIIAIVDTGVDLSHPDLAAKIVAGRNFITPGTPPEDDQGHGTHVASIAASATNNGLGTAGVDWNARIMPIKTMDEEGIGTDSVTIPGLIWAVDNGANVINMSLGGPNGSSAFQNAVTYAYNQGVLVVAAAGNEFMEGNPASYPAAFPIVLAVAATDSNDDHAVFSNSGSYVDVAAPGVGIYAAFWRGTGDDYGTKNGTSMATPHVAGLAALLLSVNSQLTPDQLTQLITSSATDVQQPGRDDFSGFGRIDAAAALAAMGNFPPPPASALKNGAFEMGANGDWVEESLVNGGQGSLIYPQSALPTGVIPQSGSFAAWLGGASSEVGDLSQSFTVTQGEMPLTFSYQIRSTDTCGHDTATVQVDSQVKATYDLCAVNATDDWARVAIDVSDHISQTVTLSFHVVTNGSAASSFFVDDVFLAASAHPPTQSTIVMPGSPAILTSADGSVQVAFPTGSVAATTLVQVTTGTVHKVNLETYLPTKHIFTVNAWDGWGQPTTQLSSPFTLTLTYADADWQAAGIASEKDLNLWFWDGAAWRAMLPCAGCAHDTTTNQFVVVLDHLTQFGVLAAKRLIYLPTVIAPVNCHGLGDADDIFDALVLCDGKTLAGNVDQSDKYDVFKIDIEANRKIAVQLTGTSGDANLSLYAPGSTSFRTSGPVAWSATAADSNETLTGITQVGGEWYVLVRSADGSTDYQLTLTVQESVPPAACSPSPPGDSNNIADALTICPAQVISGQVSQSDRSDVFAVPLQTGQFAILDLTGSGGNANLYLYAPDATDVFSNTPVGGSENGDNQERIAARFTMSNSATWYVQVYANSGATDYTLTFTSPFVTTSTSQSRFLPFQISPWGLME